MIDGRPTCNLNYMFHISTQLLKCWNIVNSNTDGNDISINDNLCLLGQNANTSLLSPFLMQNIIKKYIIITNSMTGKRRKESHAF
jgi:hypothetical protein